MGACALIMLMFYRYDPSIIVAMYSRLLTEAEIIDFQNSVFRYLNFNRPEMPWRLTPTAYFVLVSEIMLQQTQVGRVIPKFETFIARFPDIQSLAAAPMSEVLTLWSGLGYNRRAKFLWQAARMVVQEYDGEIPHEEKELVKLPGIGPNTAGAVAAYAFEQPSIFIETNVRTVYLHHFFADSLERVDDRTLGELVALTLFREDPRQWYWALMDYGAFLKQTAGGWLTRSSHYRKQSPLRGSPREMRGRIIRALTVGTLTERELRVAVKADERFRPALTALQREDLIEPDAKGWRLTATPDIR